MQAGQVWFLASGETPGTAGPLRGAHHSCPAGPLVPLRAPHPAHAGSGRPSRSDWACAFPPLSASHIDRHADAYTLLGTDEFLHARPARPVALAPEVGAAPGGHPRVAWIHAAWACTTGSASARGTRALATLLFATALLMPVLALAGFRRAAGARWRGSGPPGWVEGTLRATRAPGAARARRPRPVRATVAGRLRGGPGRRARRARGPGARRAAAHDPAITYPSRPCRPVSPGLTVLETSREAGIPHASVCGGRGRCSTCRVRIVHGLEDLPPPATMRRACSAGWALPRTCGWPASSGRAK